MSASSQTQSPSVAIQGEPGAFSHEAARRLFGPDLDLVPTRTFDDLFAAVKEKEAEVGVVPVENTLAGSVQGNLDRILETGLHVVGETRVRIRLCLLVRPGTPVTEIRSAASHPVALQQCTAFFKAHPSIEPVAVYDTAGSVRDLMAGDVEYDAAIGSELAAVRYGAEVLAVEIEDDHRNFTRFFAVSRTPHPEPSPMFKTSLAFVVSHEPGSLHHALGAFAESGVDLTKLESRPIPGHPWEYRFYADVRGQQDGRVALCLEELRRRSTEVRILGAYPEGAEGA